MAIQGTLRVLGVSTLAAPLVIGIGGAIWLWVALSGWAEAGKDSPGPENSGGVACAPALAFARGNLPAGAHEERCTRVDGLSTVTGSFRMNRDGLDAWLDAAFPGAREYARSERPKICPKPGPGFDPEGGDQCLGVDHPDAVPGRARRVEISVEQQPGYDVRIRFVAHEA